VTDKINLSVNQQEALKAIKKWIKTKERFFLLQGFAGTGKTFLTKMISQSDIPNLYFSATTNKASKVLENNLGVSVKTIYSLLGLKMEEREDRLVLTKSDKPIYFPRGSIIVVDEASMVGRELLNVIISMPAIRVIFVGDPAQLPPVNEVSSPAWKTIDNESNRAILRTVMRNDNELLNMATEIRSCLREKNYVSPIRQDVSAEGDGVYLFDSKREFEDHLLSKIRSVNFNETKVIAWRNDTVNYYNTIIRRKLGFTQKYEAGDIILIGKPVVRNDEFIAHTDDEYIVEEATNENYVVIDDIHDIEYWELYVKNNNQEIILKVPVDQDALNVILSRKAIEARNASKGGKRAAWMEFWDLKNYFDEVRYGYALTAHRAQGSTITECYIDQQDILCNYKSQEAFQCLYVAATRPTKRIYTF